MTKHRKKKLRKTNPSQLKEKILKYFLKNPKKRMNAGQLIKKLRIKGNRDAVQNALNKLHGEDILRPVSEYKFVLNKKHRVSKSSAAKSTGKQIYTGTVDSIKSGAAYILVDNLEMDIYVSPNNLIGAFNGDVVEVAVMKSKGRRPEGKVTKIVERNTRQIMGVLNDKKKNYCKVQSTSIKKPLTVNVSKDNVGKAKLGDKVMVEITNWPKEHGQPIWGEVRRVFKDIDAHNWSMESILVENGFNSEHTAESMKEAAKFKDKISEEEIAKRRDFRDILTFTIDPDTAQDFDDAISYEILENGDVEIGVHIADVTHFLKPKTALDKEALERSTSVYLVDRCIPMLPERLSNNLCSLMPNVDRLVFSAVFTFDKKNSKLKSEWFGKSIIHSAKRFTYEEAQIALEDKKGLHHEELNHVNKIAKKLRKEKFKNGAINFESDEVKFILDDKNVPTGVFVKERKDVHLLIEDFMLLANKRVARFLALKDAENPVPNVYRIHDSPNLDKVSELAEYLKEFGVELDYSTPEAVAKSYNELAKKAKKDPVYKLLMQLAIRTMSKAAYSTNNIGHYGLRFEHYSHFTSPIRRYSDVLTHRILEKNLTGKANRVDKNKLEAKCIHISAQERKAMIAERDSIKYKQVEYISTRIGETFEGVVSGMIERGVFIELSETKAEGFVPFTLFKHGFAYESRYKATSRNGKKILRMGDKVMVKVLGADMERRQIDLEVI